MLPFGGIDRTSGVGARVGPVSFAMSLDPFGVVSARSIRQEVGQVLGHVLVAWCDFAENFRRMVGRRNRVTPYK